MQGARINKQLDNGQVCPASRHIPFPLTKTCGLELSENLELFWYPIAGLQCFIITVSVAFTPGEIMSDLQMALPAGGDSGPNAVAGGVGRRLSTDLRELANFNDPGPSRRNLTGIELENWART